MISPCLQKSEQVAYRKGCRLTALVGVTQEAPRGGGESDFASLLNILMLSAAAHKTLGNAYR
jgi:hypothetical protein